MCKSKKDFRKEFLTKRYPKYSKMTKKQQQNFENKIDHKALYDLNSYVLKNTEKKEYSYLKITEPGRLDTEEDIFSYENIYDFGERWRKFQIDAENKCKNDFTEKKISTLEDFSIYLNGDWLRYFEKDSIGNRERMKYACIYSLEDYIYIEIEEYFNKYLKKKIPHGYFYPYNVDLFQPIEGSKYLKMTDSEKRAGGKEKELEKIQNKWYQKDSYKIRTLIIEKCKPFSGMVFRKLKYDHGIKNWENHMQIDIVGGVEAAKKINFKTYLYNLSELEQPFGIVKNLLKEIKKEIKKTYFKEYFKEI